MKFRLPRDLIVDTDNIPEDFEVQVQKAFAGYTEMTAKDYTFQDKLLFIDVCVGILHGDKNDSEAVMELMKDTFEYQVSEYGTFPNESDFLSTEFMEMCYKEGLAYPCDLSPKDLSRIQRAIEKDGDTLIALSHQSHRIWTMESFALDGMSGLHTCKSTAGKTCDELFALVRRNKEHEDGFLGWLALYRFKMTDLSFTLEQLGYLDKIPIATVGLRKKDGTLIAGIR